jgi:hypothetical protein
MKRAAANCKLKQKYKPCLSIPSNNAFTQNSQPYIEVAVEESIGLKVKSMEINIYVDSYYSQLEEAKEMMYFELYYDNEEDYYYEYLLEEEPKQITKEMKKEYEERQEQRKEQEAEMAKVEENFTAYTVKNLMEDLDRKNIKYELLLDYSGKGNDYYDEYDYYDLRTDSVVQVIVTSAEDYTKLQSFTENNDATVERNGETEKESAEGKYEELLPILAEKAKNQGNLIANALGQEIGGLLSCSNIHPSLDYSSIDGIEERMDYEYEYYYGNNPFEESSDITVQLVFRFAVK